MLEPAEVRIRVMSVRLGAAATFAIALAGLFYYRATPDGLHRPLMTALAWCFMAGAALLLVAPVRGLVAGRGRTAFFVVWSAVSTGAIAVLLRRRRADLQVGDVRVDRVVAPPPA